MQNEMQRVIEEYFPEEKRGSLQNRKEMSLLDVNIYIFFLKKRSFNLFLLPFLVSVFFSTPQSILDLRHANSNH